MSNILFLFFLRRFLHNLVKQSTFQVFTGKIQSNQYEEFAVSLAAMPPK